MSGERHERNTQCCEQMGVGFYVVALWSEEHRTAGCGCMRRMGEGALWD